MPDRRPWEPVEEHLGAGRGEEDGSPVVPAWTEAQVLEHLEEERPGDRIKGAGNVELEHDAWLLEVGELPGGLLDHYKKYVNL